MKYTRIYCDATGESHFEDVTVNVTPVDFASPAPPLNLAEPIKAERLILCDFPRAWVGDWHPAPRRQFYIQMSGRLQVTVSDGEVREFSSGSLVLLDDTSGVGHVTKVLGDAGVHGIFVQLDESNVRAAAGDVCPAASTNDLVETAVNAGIRLVFHAGGGDAGIFYREEDFLRFRQIAIALRTAQTWGEFRTMLPDGEFEKLSHWLSNEGDYVYSDGDQLFFIEDSQFKDFLLSHGEDYVIRSATPFDREFVDGVSDGDYPPWLYETAADRHLLPLDFIQDYGQKVNSMVSGDWWTFPVERFDEMKLRLEAAGFTVWRTHAPTLDGW